MPAMQPIKMPIQSGALDDPSGTQERLVNLYAEEAPTQARSKIVVRSVPGLVQTGYIGTGPIRAMSSESAGALYIVSGSHLWRISEPNGVTTTVDMGDVGSPAGTGIVPPIVTIAAGPAQVVVCVPPNAYAAAATDATVHQITATTSGAFPAVSSVAYVEGFFVFTTPDGSEFFSSAALDPNTYDALDFAYADRSANIILRAVSHLDRLWLMGQNGVEVWVLSGSGSFPFQPDAGGFIPEDVVSAQSIAICNESLFWLSGSCVVYRQSGYKAIRVSTHAIESQIYGYARTGGGLTAALVVAALSYSHEGHEMYALTLVVPGTGGRTWIYDATSQLWHERSSDAAGIERWRVSCAAAPGASQFGDGYSGAVFVHDEFANDDAGLPAQRIAVTPPLSNADQLSFMSRLEVECKLGQQPITLDWTDDDGATWSAQRSLSVSGNRAFTTRLGSYRRRTMRLSATGQVRMYAINAQQNAGTV